MKLQHIVLFALAIVGLSFFAACKKEDKTPPTVTVNTPADGAAFAVGATIDINGTVGDETELKEAVIEVTKATNDSLLFTKSAFVTGKTATVTASYVVNVPSGTVIEVHVIATDAALNSYDEHAHLQIN